MHPLCTPWAPPCASPWVPPCSSPCPSPCAPPCPSLCPSLCAPPSAFPFCFQPSCSLSSLVPASPTTVLTPLCTNSPPLVLGGRWFLFLFINLLLGIGNKINTVFRTFGCALALCDSDIAPGGELFPLSVPCSLPSSPFLLRLQVPLMHRSWGCVAPAMVPTVPLAVTVILGGLTAAQSPSESKQRPFRYSPTGTTCSCAAPRLIGMEPSGD